MLMTPASENKKAREAMNYTTHGRRIELDPAVMNRMVPGNHYYLRVYDRIARVVPVEHFPEVLDWCVRWIAVEIDCERVTAFHAANAALSAHKNARF